MTNRTDRYSLNQQTHNISTKDVKDIDKHLLNHNNQQYKCICQMCSCGRHRCPMPKIQGDFESSYKSQFKEIHHKVQASQPQPYVYKERHYPPQALQTRYKDTFRAPEPVDVEELNRSRLENVGRSIVRPHIPFVCQSSYTDQFKPFSLKQPNNPEDHYLDKREKIPDYNFQYPAKFEGKSSYTEQFESPKPPKLQNYPHPIYKKPEVPFYGSSSYQDNFKGYKLAQPTYEAYSQSLSQVPKVRFEGQSSYKDQFKGFKVESPNGRGGKACQVDNMKVPQTNFLNSSPHMYYDEVEHKFI